MKIGFIGVGAIGGAVARIAARAGHHVLLSNRRGPDSLLGLASELGGEAVTADRALDAPIVVAAVKWRDLQEALTSRTGWRGQVLIDTSNATHGPPEFRPVELGETTSSQFVQSWVPGARVVKTLNSWEPDLLIKDPVERGGRRVQFVSGDDAGARAEAIALLESLGFAPIDLGTLAAGSRLQQFPGGPFPRLNLLRLPRSRGAAP